MNPAFYLQQQVFEGVEEDSQNETIPPQAFEAQDRMAGHTLALYNFMATEVQKDPSEESPPDPQKVKEAMLQLVDEQLENLKDISEFNRQSEQEGLQAKIKSLNMPDKAAADKILRYETAIERQLYRALHELMRIQAARRGDRPMVPIAIDLDVSPGD